MLIDQEVKYTIVIPTLWKSNRTKKLIDNLQECEYVDEIIIIDNTLTTISDITEGKIRTISFGENIYVNPAWNKGVELSRNNLIALVNDDINFNPNIFKIINKDTIRQFGIIGMGENNYKLPDIDGEPALEVWKTGMNDWGWGCLIILDRKYWIDIPDNIKIWYGDDVIKNINPLPKAVLKNFRIDTEMSTTSHELIWNKRKEEDRINFINYLETVRPPNP